MPPPLTSPRRSRLAALALALLLSAPAPAAVVPGLYEAVVPVIDKTEKARMEGMQEALRQVIVKLTGDRGAPARAAALLRDTQRLVVQYRYQDIAPTAPDGAGTPLPGVWVQFDRATLERALAQSGLPLWGRERPAVLVWLAAETDGTTVLAGSGDTAGYAPALKRHAERRGLPLVLPLLDLDDQVRISADDVRQGSMTRVQEASIRYGTEATATALLSRAGESLWRARFVLDFNDQAVDWSVQGSAPEALIGEGIDHIADALAVRFARTGAAAGSESAVQLLVEGIGTAEQYADVQQYLKSLNTVTAVSVRKVEPDRVTFVVSARGGMQAIADAISLGRVLQAVGNAGDGRYRLLQ